MTSYSGHWMCEEILMLNETEVSASFLPFCDIHPCLTDYQKLKK